MAPFLFLLVIFANALLNSVVVGAAPSPMVAAEPSSCRKLGNHQSTAFVSSSPSEAPRSKMKVQAASGGGSGSGKEIQLENREHHKSRDKSIAGGGVILGGLATTFLVAIICYIRATRRQNSEVK